MKKCETCGKDISDYAVVCPNCGYMANATSNSGKTVPSKSKPSRKLYIVVAVVAAVLLIPSGFIFACAQNAYNCVVGKTPAGIGVIFFEEDIINSCLSRIITVRTGAIMAIFLCAAVIAVFLFMVWRTAQKYEKLS